MSQDAPSSSKCTFQIELNGSYLSTLATFRMPPRKGDDKEARLLLVLLLCLSYVILSKNDYGIAFSSAANAKLRLFFILSKFLIKNSPILRFLNILYKNRTIVHPLDVGCPICSINNCLCVNNDKNGGAHLPSPRHALYRR